MIVRLQSKETYQQIKIDQIKSIFINGLAVEIVWMIGKTFKRLEISLNDYRLKIDNEQ